MTLHLLKCIHDLVTRNNNHVTNLNTHVIRCTIGVNKSDTRTIQQTTRHNTRHVHTNFSNSNRVISTILQLFRLISNILHTTTRIKGRTIKTIRRILHTRHRQTRHNRHKQHINRHVHRVTRIITRINRHNLQFQFIGLVKRLQNSIRHNTHRHYKRRFISLYYRNINSLTNSLQDRYILLLIIMMNRYNVITIHNRRYRRTNTRVLQGRRYYVMFTKFNTISNLFFNNRNPIRLIINTRNISRLVTSASLRKGRVKLMTFVIINSNRFRVTNINR